MATSKFETPRSYFRRNGERNGGRRLKTPKRNGLCTMEATEAASAGNAISNSVIDSELRAAVQYAVIQLCAQDDSESTSKMSPRAIAALAELTCLYAQHSLASDLQAFSTHAGRRTITEADVKLSARKIPEPLLQRLNNFCEIHCASTSTGNDGGGKRKATKKRASAGTKAITVDLQNDKQKPVYDAESDSSSDSDMMMEIDRPAAATTSRRTAPVSKPANDSVLGADTDDDDDDGIKVLGSLQSRLAKRKTATTKENIDILDSTDDDDDNDDDAVSKPLVTAKLAHPPPRFRLQATNTTNTKAAGVLSSDSEDEDILQNPFQEENSTKKDTGSLVRQILEDMDDDSVLSGDAGKENDL